MDINNLIANHKSQINFIGPQNGKLKQVQHIINNTAPNPDKLIVLEGIWAHEKAISAGLPIRSFICCPEHIHSNEAITIAETLFTLTNDIYAVSAKSFQKLSERDQPDGLLSLAQLPKYDINKFRFNGNGAVVVLDGLEIPGNIGTILRSCDGAGIDAMLICNRRARLSHPKLIKGSMGAAFTIPIFEFAEADECQKWLKENGFTVYLADTRAEKSYNQYPYTGNTALVMGSERYGITKLWYDGDAKLLSIPMRGVCDSLNVGVAASIVLYEICGKKR